MDFTRFLAFVDHGQFGTGEPVAALLRAGNTGSNTAADHITVTRKALAQLPSTHSVRPGRKILIRTDGAGSSHAFLKFLHRRRVSYSIGFAEHTVRDGAWVTDATGMLDLSAWPAGMRVIVRKERPHPGAQLRFTDSNGMRLTAFATNSIRGSLQNLELRHCRRARCEDRIRIAKDTGLENLPLHGFDQNRVWLMIVHLAVELTAWTQMLAFTDHDDRRWEPKRLQLRIFSIAGRIATHARYVHLRLSKNASWSDLIVTALTRLAALPAPA